MQTLSSTVLVKPADTPLYRVSAAYLANYEFVGTKAQIVHLIIDPDHRFLTHYQLPLVQVLRGDRWHKLTKAERVELYERWGSFHEPGVSNEMVLQRDARLKERMGLS